MHKLIDEHRPRLRHCRQSEWPDVADMIDAAYGGPEESRRTERLRDAGELPILLIAETDGSPSQPIGAIGFSSLAIEQADREVKALTISPLAVAEARRLTGVGGALLRAGLIQARRAGAEIVCTIGNHLFFERYGFNAQAAAKIESPWSGPQFLALALTDSAGQIAGKARYPEAFEPFSGRDPAWNLVSACQD